MTGIIRISLMKGLENRYLKLRRKNIGNSDKGFSNFINTCNTVLNKQLPKKNVTGNQSPFTNKTLCKAIML